ncbi:MAG: beta-ketoacyl-ACP synthase 3 [Actinomycetota bacterium]|nr:beta-ketoacyl-ACP synthase 3 [Actinomycetota bacterium]
MTPSPASALSPARSLASSNPPYSGARLLGFGAAQPAAVTTGTELGARYGRSAEWIEARTGIRELRRLGTGELIGELALSAARDAIAGSHLPAEQIDLVIAASCSNRAGSPTLSSIVAGGLASSAAQLDLNGACSGFCYGISTADALIRAGSVRHVLLVAAEHMSDLIDPDDVGTGIIFGDGAGAAVLGPNLGAEPAIGPVAWGSDGSNSTLIEFGDEPYMRMQGRQVFRWAVECIHHVALEACAKAGISPRDIDVFVPHQANLRIGSAIAEKLGLSNAVVSEDIVISGNTSAASIPIAVTRLTQSGRVRPGQLALLVGFGAGLAYAAQVVRLP